MKYQIIVQIFILLACMVNCEIQWQQGESHEIKREQEHVLKDTNNQQRQVVIRVNFPEPFIVTPKIVLSIKRVAWQQGQGANFKVKVIEVDPQGFNYQVSVNQEQSFDNLNLKWFAFVDPHLQTETYEFKVYDINGESDKEQSTFPIEFERSLKTAPNVAVFILGAQFNEDGAQFDTQVQVQDVDEKGCNIKVSTYQEGNPYSVYVQVIIIPQERGQVFDLGGSKDNGQLNLRQLRSQDFKYQVTRTTFDPAYFQNDGFFFWGVSGFSSGYQKNFDVQLANRRYSETDGTFQVKMGSIKSTNLKFANMNLFVYAPRDDCAFLFSGCNFTGNGISICKNEDQNSFVGTHLEQHDVKSIYVPLGETLTLFEEENLQGRRATISVSQDCIEQLEADS